MIFYLTNILLDVIWGAGFWIIKKTSSGIYYLLWYKNDTSIDIDEYETIILTKEDIENDDILKEILEKSLRQEEQIEELSLNIKELKNLIINQKIQ